MARTVDHISEGRLILGIGSGWKERDYDEYGYEFGTPGSRLDELAAALPRIERRLARLNPAPTRTIPVLIGGGGVRKTLRLVAQHATIWHHFTDLAEFRQKSDVLDTWCAEVGRDPRDIERATQAPAGNPADVGPAFVEAGAGMFTLGVGGPDHDLSGLRSWVRWRDSL